MRNPLQMIRMVHLISAAALALAIAAPSESRADIDKSGTTAANFLSLGSGPRILGMGGATLGLGDDLAGGMWNPAALGWMQRGAFAVSHASLDEESLQEWVGFGGRVGKSGTRWSVSGLYQDNGTFEGRDASNNPTGDFSASSFAVGAHVAQQFGPLTVGLGVKSVHEKLADVTGSGLTFDGGLMYRQGMFGVGLAAQNVGGKMAYQGSSYAFPTNYGAGVAVNHPSGLTLALDANFPDAYYSDMRLGLEWRWKQTLALRGGYRHEMVGGASDDPLTGPTFGIGAGMNGFWFDYGYLLSGLENGGQHRVALTFFPGMWSGLGTDPYGQGEIRKEFETPGLIGPTVPKSKKTKDE